MGSSRPTRWKMSAALPIFRGVQRRPDLEQRSQRFGRARWLLCRRRPMVRRPGKGGGGSVEKNRQGSRGDARHYPWTRTCCSPPLAAGARASTCRRCPRPRPRWSGHGHRPVAPHHRDAAPPLAAGARACPCGSRRRDEDGCFRRP